MAYKNMSLRLPTECREYLEEIVKRGDAKNASNALIMIVVERMERESRTGPKPFRTPAPRDQRKKRSTPKKEKAAKKIAAEPVRDEAPKKTNSWSTASAPDLSGWTEEQKRVFYEAHPETRRA